MVELFIETRERNEKLLLSSFFILAHIIEEVLF